MPGDGDRLPWRASRRPTAEDGQADGRRLPDEVASRPGGGKRLLGRGDRVPSGGDGDDGMASGGNCLPGGRGGEDDRPGGEHRRPSFSPPVGK